MVKVCFYIKFQSYDINQKYHFKLLNYFNATVNFGITWVWVSWKCFCGTTSLTTYVLFINFILDKYFNFV